MPFRDFEKQRNKFAILAKHVNGVNVSRYVFGAVVTLVISLSANLSDFGFYATL